MSTTLTIRIPRRLKEKMEKNPEPWSDEIRNFLEERVRQVELIKTIQEIDSRQNKPKIKIDSTQLIREDRERQN
jgi:hypothetical protein